MDTKISAELQNVMGTDLDVVNIARVSFGKESYWLHDGEGNRYLSDADRNLIGYLARGCSRGEWDRLIDQARHANEGELRDILTHVRHIPVHWSPMAHPKLRFRIKAPIFVARQYVKHQVGFDWNEVSRRYVADDIEFWWPDNWRSQAENVKQGSGGVLDKAKEEQADDAYAAALDACEAAYDRLKGLGVCTEQARAILPLSLQTTWIMTGSLMGWARVCQARLDTSHAQEEAAELTSYINKYCAEHFPVSWRALMG